MYFVTIPSETTPPFIVLVQRFSKYKTACSTQHPLSFGRFTPFTPGPRCFHLGFLHRFLLFHVIFRGCSGRIFSPIIFRHVGRCLWCSIHVWMRGCDTLCSCSRSIAHLVARLINDPGPRLITCLEGYFPLQSSHLILIEYIAILIAILYRLFVIGDCLFDRWLWSNIGVLIRF